MTEHKLPADIERTSLSIITKELEALGIALEPANAPVVKRVIHTTADFDYAKNLYLSSGAAALGASALAKGTPIITDTNMARAGVSKPGLAKCGGEVLCFMAEPEVAEAAKLAGTTRAVAAVKKAADAVAWTQQYLRSHFSEDVSILRLASILGVSRSSLHEQSSRRMGMSPPAIPDQPAAGSGAQGAAGKRKQHTGDHRRLRPAG